MCAVYHWKEVMPGLVNSTGSCEVESYGIVVGLSFTVRVALLLVALKPSL